MVPFTILHLNHIPILIPYADNPTRNFVRRQHHEHIKGALLFTHAILEDSLCTARFFPVRLQPYPEAVVIQNRLHKSLAGHSLYLELFNSLFEYLECAALNC